MKTSLPALAVGLVLSGCCVSDPPAQGGMQIRKGRPRANNARLETPSPKDAAELPPALAGPVDPEPNDRPVNAVELKSGQGRKGLLEPPDASKHVRGDEDWFVLPVASGAAAWVSAEVSGADDVDLVLEWMEVDASGLPGRAIIEADLNRRRPGPERLPALSVPSGKAYFRVREAWRGQRRPPGSRIPYTITVTRRRSPPPADSEPNDDVTTAIPLALAERGSGSIGHHGDIDLWRVELPAAVRGKLLRVDVGGVPELALRASLSFGGTGSPTVGVRGAKGESLAFRNYLVPSHGSEQLFVSVGARSGAVLGPRYSLEVRPEEPIVDGQLEAEPNDSPRRATRITAESGGVLHGVIERTGDRDRYLLAVEEPRVVHAALRMPVGLDLALELIGPNGRSVARLRSADAGGQEFLRAWRLEPGEWQLLVSADGSASAGDKRYRLDVELADPELHEGEPNDTLEQRGVARLRPRTPRKGWIHPPGDVDYWRFEVAGAETARRLELRVEPPSALPLEVTLYRQGVGMIATQRVSEPTTLAPVLDNGAYYVRLSAGASRSKRPLDAYQLELEPAPTIK